MKANANKRKIFDAVDLLTEDTSVQTTEVKAENGIEQIAIDSIKAFHNHPFHLYEGERLNDMVESIREHGILNPVIVLKTDDGYEMLSGHNRANAAKIAGLSEVPAIIKVGLSKYEAYVYVIETNLMQRSFAELLPSEKAAVMAAHYDKVCCQGKRNDIIRELQILSGIEPEETSCHNGKKLNSLDVIASEYGFSSRNAARYLRLNYLIQPFKNLLDENKIALLAAVDVSYMTKGEQQMLWNIVDRQGLKVKPVYAEKLRKGAVGAGDIRDFRGSLTTDIEKGVFITTGSFTKAAKEEASNPGKQQIDLIDGEEFINKIAQYGIGVREVITYEIDEEFFLKI